jgi:GNAT superfamily N-acetyltransferase
MIFREAEHDDIKQMHIVRNAVKENILSNPTLVTHADYEEYLFKRGSGWVCLVNDILVGFSIVDLKEHNIWALFVHPDFEKQGIGKRLHGIMLDWYFANTEEKVWLGTSPGTRAAAFYKMLGWKESGMHGANEIKFEMSFEEWKGGVSVDK